MDARLCIGAACLAAAALIGKRRKYVHTAFRTDRVKDTAIRLAMDEPPNRLILLLSGGRRPCFAPLLEAKTAFRLLFKVSWLERWEDCRLGWGKRLKCK